MPTIAVWYRAGDTDDFVAALQLRLEGEWRDITILPIPGGTDLGADIAHAYREPWDALLVVIGDQGLSEPKLGPPFKTQYFRDGLVGNIPILIIVRNAELAGRLESSGRFLTRARLHGLNVPYELVADHPWIAAHFTEAAGFDPLIRRIRREVARRQWPPAFLESDVLGDMRAAASTRANQDLKDYGVSAGRPVQGTNPDVRYRIEHRGQGGAGTVVLTREAQPGIPWPWLLVAAAAGAFLWKFSEEATTFFATLYKYFSSATPPPPAATSAQALDVSAFGPETVVFGDEALVQIYLHRTDQAAEAAAQARESDAEARRRHVTTLQVAVAIGDRIDIVLTASGASIDQPACHLEWHGEPRACQFAIHVPKDFTRDRLMVRATVLVGGKPAGSLLFFLSVVAAAPAGERVSDIRGRAARSYKYPFLSYSSKDRAKVLVHAQLLQALRHDYFLDLLKLAPGDLWKRSVYKAIDGCDVFLLFWSSNAKASKWVIAETEYALSRHGRDEDAPPDIVPIVLEGPPPPSPPDPWKDQIHFNDWMRYVISAEEADSARSNAIATEEDPEPPS